MAGDRQKRTYDQMAGALSDKRDDQFRRQSASNDRWSPSHGVGNAASGSRDLERMPAGDLRNTTLEDGDREKFPVPKRKEVGIDRPFDCAIIVCHKALKNYAECVERKLIELNLTVDVIYLIIEDAFQQALEDMVRRGLLYIVALKAEHEKHRSATVYILHGSPQEHRNIPLEDAVVLLAKNFNNYLSGLRSGSEQPSMGFLLNLLADGKHLSVEELIRIIRHLQDRHDRLLEAQGIAAGSFSNAAIANTTGLPLSRGAQGISQVLETQSQTGTNVDLQQKILNMLNANQTIGSGSNNSAMLSGLAPQFSGPSQANIVAGSGGGGSASVGLGSTDLKKLTDLLAQNPNLLRNLGGNPAMAQSKPGNMGGISTNAFSGAFRTGQGPGYGGGRPY